MLAKKKKQAKQNKTLKSKLIHTEIEYVQSPSAQKLKKYPQLDVPSKHFW